MMVSCTRRNVDRRFVVVLCLVVLITGWFLYRIKNLGQEVRHEPIQYEFKLNFIPQNVKKCEDLVQNPSKYRIELSQIHQLKRKDFNDAVQNASKVRGAEGHTGLVAGQYLIIHYLSGQPSAKRVCETGFNLGHSSFNYLTANENSIVHSFDIGRYPSTHTMSDYLKKLFPTRFFIHFGDSTKTLPEFIRNNPDFRCDFMFVDGGHFYPVALADLKNFASIASLTENIIGLDDYPTDGDIELGRAWNEVVKEGTVKELMRCTFQEVLGDGVQRGYTLGRVLMKPTG